MKVMNMINEVNGNHKVGKLVIKLDTNNKWNEQVLTAMIKRYQNIYDIWIVDYNDLVDV